jgi:hypothetical protein
MSSHRMSRSSYITWLKLITINASEGPATPDKTAEEREALSRMGVTGQALCLMPVIPAN